MKRSSATSFKEKIAFSNVKLAPIPKDVVTDQTYYIEGSTLIFFPDGVFYRYRGYDSQINHEAVDVYGKYKWDKWGLYRLEGNSIKLELMEIVNFVNCRDMIVYVGVYDEEHGTITFSKPEVDGTYVLLSIDYEDTYVHSPKYDTLNIDPSKAWINQK
jgi:hypothetical protein